MPKDNAWLPIALVVLKYAGLSIATASTIWGLTRKTTEDINGQRRLTSAGRFSLAFILLGLLTSGATTGLELQQKQLDSLKASAKEQLNAIKEAEAARVQREQEESEARERREAEERLTASAAAQEGRETLRDELSEIAAGVRARQEADRDRLNALEESNRELRNTRSIIVAGQPLSSLKLTWTFRNVPQKFQRAAAEAERKVESLPEEDEVRWGMLYGEEEREAVGYARRHFLLYPWLDALAVGEWDSGKEEANERRDLNDVGDKTNHPGTLMLVSLDEASSSVLPLGRVEYSPEMKNSAGTLEFYEEYRDWVQHFNRLENVERTRAVYFNAGLRPAGSTFEMVWDIPPGSLFKSIDRVEGKNETTSGFPRVIRIVILGRIGAYPNDPANFTEVIERIPVSGDADATNAAGRETGFMSESVLTLQPNYLPDAGVVYRMRFLGRAKVKNANPDPAIDQYYCRAAIFEGTLAAD